MVINYPRKRPEIMKMMVSWKRFNNRTEGPCAEKIKSRQRVLCFIFDRGCVIINDVTNIEFNLGVLCF